MSESWESLPDIEAPKADSWESLPDVATPAATWESLPDVAPLSAQPVAPSTRQPNADLLSYSTRPGGQSAVSPEQIEGITSRAATSARNAAANAEIDRPVIPGKTFGQALSDAPGAIWDGLKQGKTLDPIAAGLNVAQSLKENVADPLHTQYVADPAEAALTRWAQSGNLSPETEFTLRALGPLVLGRKATQNMDPARLRQVRTAHEDEARAAHDAEIKSGGTMALGRTTKDEFVAERTALRESLLQELGMLPVYMVNLPGAASDVLTTKLGSTLGGAAIGAIEGIAGAALTPGDNIKHAAVGGAAIGGAAGKLFGALSKPAKRTFDESTARVVAFSTPEQTNDLAKALSALPEGKPVSVAARVQDVGPDGQLVEKVAGQDASGKLVAQVVDDKTPAFSMAAAARQERREANRIKEGVVVESDAAKAAPPPRVEAWNDYLANTNKYVQGQLRQLDEARKGKAGVATEQGLSPVDEAGKAFGRGQYDPRTQQWRDGHVVLLDESNIVRFTQLSDPQAQRAAMRLRRVVEVMDEATPGQTKLGELLYAEDGKELVGPLKGHPRSVTESKIVPSNKTWALKTDHELDQVINEWRQATPAPAAAQPAPGQVAPASTPGLEGPSTAPGTPRVLFGAKQPPAPPAPPQPPLNPPPAAPPGVPPPTPAQVPYEAGIIKGAADKIRAAMRNITHTFARMPETVGKLTVGVKAAAHINNDRNRISAALRKQLGRDVSDADVAQIQKNLSDVMDGYTKWEDFDKLHPDLAGIARKEQEKLVNELQANHATLEEFGVVPDRSALDAAGELQYSGPRLFLRHLLPKGKWAKEVMKDKVKYDKLYKAFHEQIRREAVKAKAQLTPEQLKARTTDTLHTLIGDPRFDKPEMRKSLVPGDASPQKNLKPRQDMRPMVDALAGKYANDVEAVETLAPLFDARKDKTKDIKPVAEKLLKKLEKGGAAPELIQDVRNLAEADELSLLVREALGESGLAFDRIGQGIAFQRAKIASLEAWEGLLAFPQWVQAGPPSSMQTLQAGGALPAQTSQAQKYADEFANGEWFQVGPEWQNTVGKAMVGRYVKKEAFQTMLEAGQAGDRASNFVQKILRPWRIGHTALNPATWLTNALGNISGLSFAGVDTFKPGRGSEALRNAIEGWAQYSTNPLADNRVAQLYRKAKEYGLTTSGIGDFSRMDANLWRNKLLRMTRENPKLTFSDMLSQAGEYGATAFNTLPAFYGAIDPIAKHTAFMDNLLKAGMDIRSNAPVDTRAAQKYLGQQYQPGWDNKNLEEAIMREAAQRVMYSFPMLDRLPKVQNEMAKWAGVVTADFFPTMVELMRVYSHLPGRMATEPGFALTQIKNSVVGAALLGGAYAGTKATGITDEQLADDYAALPETDKKFHPGYMPTPLRDDKGDTIFVDIAGPILQPLQWMSGAPGINPLSQEEFSASQLGKRIIANTMLDLMGGTLGTWSQTQLARLGMADMPFQPKKDDIDGWQGVVRDLADVAGWPAFMERMGRVPNAAQKAGQGDAYGAARSLFGGYISSPNPMSNVHDVRGDVRQLKQGIRKGVKAYSEPNISPLPKASGQQLIDRSLERFNSNK